MASTTTATAEQLHLIAHLTRRRDQLELEVREHQRETSRRVAATVRLCGRCRCPGHTRGRCNVFTPIGTNYLDLLPAQHEHQQQRNDDAEVRRILALNRDPQTEHECVQEWASRNAVNRERYEQMSSRTRWDFARRGHAADLARIDAALVRVHAQELGIPQPAPAPVYDTPPRPGAATQYYEPSAPPAPAPAPRSAPVEPVVVEKPVEETTCAICLEELTDCNKMITACGHQYHANCLIKTMAMTKKNTCPTCRKPVM